MTHPCRFLVPCAVIGALILPAVAAAQDPRLVTADLIGRHVGVLADDSMRGRATPSAELEKTAAYVVAVFRRAGLEPAGDSGGYVQRYPIGRDSTVARPMAPNVVGVLRGGDTRLRGEYVAVVAHMDHLGVGRAVHGDSVYNGADDNASGTAGVMALAAAFAAQPRQPRRSVLFLIVSGEERGLWGSRAFVAHPTVPLDSIVGLVNLDMIGRNRPDSVFLNGWGKSTISELVRTLAVAHPELGLSVGPDVEDRPQTPGDSDHYPFQHQGIPYVFFYTGDHADYHRPSDEPVRLDADKAARVTRLALYTLWAMADQTARPKWDPEARRLNVLPRKH
jgi:Zn-dependent M28 family amino/carboxypeptidase